MTAQVRPVGVRNGQLGVPDDVRDVGWWSGSALPGSRTGTTILDGHVDSAAAGVGALFALQELRSGDLVVVGTDHTTSLTYRVYARRIYAKKAGLPRTLFTGDGSARLVLITCGGPFDRRARSYLDNVAVYATPVTA